jgi:heat shock protein 4
MNADEAVARGAALQSAILSPRFKVLPYEIQESQPYPIKLSWDEVAEVTEGDDEATPSNSVVMFDRGLNFPIVRRVTLKRAGEFAVKCSYDDAATQFGIRSDVTKDICTFKITAPAGDLKKVRVNVKQDIHGILTLSSGQMIEEIEDEEELPEGEAKEGEEKKKKIKKTLLEFTTVRSLDWTKPEIEKAYECEVAMANADRIVRETADMRNELESYIYGMRDKIVSESGLAPFATDDEKSTFPTALENTENWLYEDGFDATKSVYAEKLGALKKVGGPIEQRQQETNARPGAVATLQRKVEMYTTFLNDSQVLTEYKMLDKQGSLAPNVDPAVTVAQINVKSQELTDVCSPIRNKPAPKPKKEEPKPEEKAPEAPAPPAEEKPAPEGEPMEAEKEEDKPAAEPMDMD